MSRVKKPKYHVLKGGVPTYFTNIPPIFVKRVLLPVAGSATPHVFGGTKSAEKAIQRTERHADTMRGSMVDEMPKLQPLLAKAAWEVVPCS